MSFIVESIVALMVLATTCRCFILPSYRGQQLVMQPMRPMQPMHPMQPMQPFNPNFDFANLYPINYPTHQFPNIVVPPPRVPEINTPGVSVITDSVSAEGPSSAGSGAHAGGTVSGTNVSVGGSAHSGGSSSSSGPSKTNSTSVSWMVNKKSANAPLMYNSLGYYGQPVWNPYY